MNYLRQLIPLRYLADWRSVFTVFAALSVIAIQWGDYYRHPLLWCLSVLLIYPCFLINHNHQHIPVFTNSFLNHFFDLLLTFVTGLRASLLIPLHNRNHHAENNGPGDYMSTSNIRLRSPFLRLLFYPIFAALAYAPQKKSLMQAIRNDERWLHRRLTLQRILVIGALGMLFALRPLDTLWIIVIPWALSHYWVVNANFIQHEGCDHNSTNEHSRDLTGWLVNWYTFNGGYHTVHHERPYVHWSELPFEHRKRFPNISPNLAERWFLMAIWRLATGRLKQRSDSL
jgi:fatty acid desaturase